MFDSMLELKLMFKLCHVNLKCLMLTLDVKKNCSMAPHTIGLGKGTLTFSTFSIFLVFFADAPLPTN